MLAAAVVTGSEYAQNILSTLAQRSGWEPGQVDALRAGKDLGEDKTDALIAVIRAAAADCGRVSDAAWARAAGAGWTDAQLAEAFGCLGLAVFTAYFLNYAATEPELTWNSSRPVS
jgi:alkylhydroperoxidase family enzyme